VAVGELGQWPAGKAVAAGVEHVGDEEGVVDGRDIDAVALQHHPVGLDVVADLEDGAILEHGLEPRDTSPAGSWPGVSPPPKRLSSPRWPTGT
jgi:hypothetical protein